ncbi:MAG TPA: hypothetical protein IAC73_05760 [Candidatus Limadaptatus stercoripullorum]|uniref:Uncharacterized protein n=1 Tax=Candidatus Limadaptatus stercoripullorum TaxID=2840846 RepID=A0A9D1NAX8_9FIRM|nr:hypothetical protein [Candidatus Limadaptatus stercoripullorum]
MYDPEIFLIFVVEHFRALRYKGGADPPGIDRLRGKTTKHAALPLPATDNGRKTRAKLEIQHIRRKK